MPPRFLHIVPLILGTACRSADVPDETMVAVPAGRVTLGCGLEPSTCGTGFYHGRESVLEVPPFWIDRYEVTVLAYRRCVSDGDCTPLIRTDQWHASDHTPARVTWHQAHDYCAWKRRRLPSEVEWETAARGHDGRLYPWGVETPTYTNKLMHIGYNRLARVGSHPRDLSPVGAYDMAGNAPEWVEDIGDELYTRKVRDYALVPKRGHRRYRIFKGGSLHSEAPLYARYQAELRDALPDGTVVASNIGFRCASGEPR